MGPSEETWWQWILGLLVTVFTGTVVGAWAASAVASNHDARIKHLEDEATARAFRCDKQRADILEELRREVCAIVKDSISNLKERQGEKLASMDKNLALIAQAQMDGKEKMDEIFARLNRRGDDQPRTTVERRQV